MQRFTELINESRKVGETNDCTVKALAIVTNLSYQKSREILQQKGRRYRKGLVSSVRDYNPTLLKTIQELGFSVKRVKCNSKTVRTLERNVKSNGTFLVFTNSHVLAMKDKEVMDWTKGRCHRVLTVWKIEK